MSIETAAKDMATRIIAQDMVEILCHHDADGIAAGAIMSRALYRAKIPFRLRVTSRVQSSTLPKEGCTLLCDLGSGLADLPEETLVIDHHIPRFAGPYHVNPRLFGIDGDRELSGAGTAYIVANALGDNRDLAGLVLTGIIGDGQDLAGKNQEIYLEGIGNGIIAKKRGLRLPGRDLAEKLAMSTIPYIPGISGDTDGVTSLINTCSRKGEGPALDLLISMLVFSAVESCREDAILNLYGDIYQLEREVIEDAHTLTMLIDACGKEGEGSLAASVCLRSTAELDKAWGVAGRHNRELITVLKDSLGKPREKDWVYEITDRRFGSDLADILSGCLDAREKPLMVVARDPDGTCHLSLRMAVTGSGTADDELGTLVHTLAAENGGQGGGHRTRAGATIAGDNLPGFISGIEKVYA
jgi:hypothetical protein